MLLVEDFFRAFTNKAIVDATKNTEVIVTLSNNIKEKVDEIVNKAVAAGGKTSREPNDQVGCMDGVFRIWTVIFGRYFIWIAGQSIKIILI